MPDFIQIQNFVIKKERIEILIIGTLDVSNKLFHIALDACPVCGIGEGSGEASFGEGLGEAS